MGSTFEYTCPQLENCSKMLILLKNNYTHILENFRKIYSYLSEIHHNNHYDVNSTPIIKQYATSNVGGDPEPFCNIKTNITNISQPSLFYSERYLS